MDLLYNNQPKQKIEARNNEESTIPTWRFDKETWDLRWIQQRWGPTSEIESWSWVWVVIIYPTNPTHTPSFHIPIVCWDALFVRIWGNVPNWDQPENRISPQKFRKTLPQPPSNSFIEGKDMYRYSIRKKKQAQTPSCCSQGYLPRIEAFWEGGKPALSDGTMQPRHQFWQTSWLWPLNITKQWKGMHRMQGPNLQFIIGIIPSRNPGSTWTCQWGCNHRSMNGEFSGKPCDWLQEGKPKCSW